MKRTLKFVATIPFIWHISKSACLNDRINKFDVIGLNHVVTYGAQLVIVHFIVVELEELLLQYSYKTGG